MEYDIPVIAETTQHEYVVTLEEKLKVVHDALRDKLQQEQRRTPTVPGWHMGMARKS